MRHHFEDEERGFGVSAPWWDTIFGTAVRRGPEDAHALSPETQYGNDASLQKVR